jgi:hypothetical protein
MNKSSSDNYILVEIIYLSSWDSVSFDLYNTLMKNFISYKLRLIILPNFEIINAN